MGLFSVESCFWDNLGLCWCKKRGVFITHQKMANKRACVIHISEIRSQLTTAELKNKRLMEAFKKTSQEIREVCYQLTGYKIDIPTSNQYRLTSMYAESANDFLLFKVNVFDVIIYTIIWNSPRGSLVKTSAQEVRGSDIFMDIWRDTPPYVG